MRRLGLRSRLTVAVSLGAALALAALTAGFNLALRSSLHHDADQVVSARASAALDTLRVEHGRVRSAEAPDQGAVDAQVWVYSGRRTIERPRAPRTVQRLAASLAGGPIRYADESATDTRLYAVPVVRSGQRAGTVVAGLSLGAIRADGVAGADRVDHLRRGDSARDRRRGRLDRRQSAASRGADDGRGRDLERA